MVSYGWGAARLSALSHLRVLYIMTHDSIGLGEDGPTHQPIETLALTRATPNMLTLRPADGNETSGAYLVALERDNMPSVLALTRQNLPHLEGSSIEAVRKGGYILEPYSDANPQVTLVGTGSEVSIAVDAAKQLKKDGVKVRVVSMPSTELFDEQPIEYRSQVLLRGVPVVSVEALSTFGWQIYSHAQVGMTSFGQSGVSLGGWDDGEDDNTEFDFYSNILMFTSTSRSPQSMWLTLPRVRSNTLRRERKVAARTMSPISSLNLLLVHKFPRSFSRSNMNKIQPSSICAYLSYNNQVSVNASELWCAAGKKQSRLKKDNLSK